MNAHKLNTASVGPEIDPQESELLQSLAAERLQKQLEDVIQACCDAYLSTAHTHTQDTMQALRCIRSIASMPADRRRRILLYPVFRYWLQAVRRSSSSTDAKQFNFFLRALPDFIWAEEAILSGTESPWLVWTDEQGGLRCPSLGRHVELGKKYRNSCVRISSQPDHVSIQCADGLTTHVPIEDLVGNLNGSSPNISEHGYFITIHQRLGDREIEVSSRDPWLRVTFTGTNQRTTGTNFFGHSNEQYPALPSLDNLQEALSILKQYWPDGYEDLKRFTHVIVPIVTPEVHYRAFTVSSRQGAIFVCDAPPNETLEMLVHENAHIKLRQFQLQDTLLSDPLDESIRVQVPWRPDLRPIPGVFEGMYVFLHVAEFLARRCSQSRNESAYTRLVKILHHLTHAREVLDQNAEFTPEGQRFFESLESWLERLYARMGSNSLVATP